MLGHLAADEGIRDAATPEVRAVIAVEDSKRPRLVVKDTVSAGKSLRKDFFKVVEALDATTPAVVIVRLKDQQGSLPAKDDQWALIEWVPKGTPEPKAKLFGKSAVSIKDVMPEVTLQTIYVTEKAELTLDRFITACQELTGKPKPLFIDMKHSNNAARIRLWMARKQGAKDLIDTKMIMYPDLKEPWYAEFNPLKKVPAFKREDGEPIIESFVILDYLEDKYSNLKPSFKPATPEDRQLMTLMIRLHDLYVASPNNTAPGFSHSQGSMYLSFGWHGKERGMDIKTRADKLMEIWKQLTWLDENIRGPYLVGSEVTLADFTWFPTCIFMEFLLPRVFGWPDLFRGKSGHFGNLAKWFTKVVDEPGFKETRQQIWEYWEEMEKQGQFKPIIEEVKNAPSELKFKYP